MNELSPVTKIASLLGECTQDKILEEIMRDDIFSDFIINHKDQMERWIKCGQEYKYAGDGKQHKNSIDKIFQYNQKENKFIKSSDSFSVFKCGAKQVLSSLETIENSFNELDRCLSYSKELITNNGVSLDCIDVIYNSDINTIERLIIEKINNYLKENFSPEIIKLIETAPTNIKASSINEKISFYKDTVCNIISSGKLKISSVKDVKSDNINKSILITNLNMDNLFGEIGSNTIVITSSNSGKYIRYNERFEISHNVEHNISNVLSISQNSRYLMLGDIYMKIMEDLKIKRAEAKQCCICGEKLKFFERNLTCKKHREFEKKLY